MRIMNRIRINYGIILFLGAWAVFSLASCSKDEYYRDGGLADPNFDGSMYEYLQSKPVEFDTIAQIIELAGLKETLENEEVTFFAPSDKEVKEQIGYVGWGGLNDYLFFLGKDTIQTLDDIDSEIWRKYLMRYLFRGANYLKDYPQLDLNLRQIYPGENYYSLNNTVLNIGTIFYDANGVKYAGYRQLAISYIPDISRPNENWYTIKVASSDIKPINGVVHTLSKENTRYFGFDPGEFNFDVAASK